MPRMSAWLYNSLELLSVLQHGERLKSHMVQEVEPCGTMTILLVRSSFRDPWEPLH